MPAATTKAYGESADYATQERMKSAREPPTEQIWMWPLHTSEASRPKLVVLAPCVASKGGTQSIRSKGGATNDTRSTGDAAPEIATPGQAVPAYTSTSGGTYKGDNCT